MAIPFFMKKGKIFACLLSAFSFFLCSSRVFARPKYEIHVSVSENVGVMSLKAIVELGKKYVFDGKIYFYLYPNRFSSPPAELNAMNYHWMYPYGFEEGWMKIVRIKVAGKTIDSDRVKYAKLPRGHPMSKIKRACLLISLPEDVDFINGRIKVEFYYSLKVPRRYGIFGRSKNGFFMAGGWYPVVIGGDNGEVNFFSSPPKSDFRVSVKTIEALSVFIGEMFFDGSAGGRDGQVEGSFRGKFQLPFGVFRKIYSFKAHCGGTEILLLTEKVFKPSRDYEYMGQFRGVDFSIPDVSKVDRMGHLLDTLCGGGEILNSFDSQFEEIKVVVIELPLRMELGFANDSIVAFSDRIYMLSPLEKFWRFHDAALLRAFFNHIYLASLDGKSFKETAMEADFIASILVEKYWLESRKQYAESLLKWAGFISSIDYLLYSPMVQFRESYFKTIAEKDWLRDEGWAFSNRLPRGKLLYEKLKDILELSGQEEKIDQIASRIIYHRRTLQQATEDVLGERMDWFFTQWSVAYPSLNYGVKDVEKKRTPEGGWVYTAFVYRQGDTQIKEPVKVKFIFYGGRSKTAFWFSSGGLGQVSVESNARLRNVVVDPEGRLFEDPALTDNHPRYDNYYRHRLRPPIVSSLSIWSSLYEGLAAFYGLFDIRRQFDLKWDGRILGLLNVMGWGFRFWVLRGLGKKKDLNFSRWYLGPFIGVFRYYPDYGYSIGEQGANTGTFSFQVGITASYDTRFYVYDPREGFRIYSSIVYNFNYADDGMGKHSLVVSLRSFYIFSFLSRFQLATYGEIRGALLDPPFGQLPNMSSRIALRAFENDETMGKMTGFIEIELRTLLVNGLGWNILNLTTLEGVKLILFTGGGKGSDTNTVKSFFSSRDIFFEAGAGIVLLSNHLGAYPGVIEFDVALPLVPSWSERRGYQPVGMYLSFFQSY